VYSHCQAFAFKLFIVHQWALYLLNSRDQTLHMVGRTIVIFIVYVQAWLHAKSRFITFTKRKETCSTVQINNVQLPRKEEVKYLGLHLNRRLTWHKHIFVKRKQLRITLTKMYWLLRRKSKLSTEQQTSLIQSNTQTNLDLRNTTLGYGFRIQHRNFGTFPVEDFAHDNGRNVVCAEYGYPKGSPNANS
jgi:hypothetical protein